MCELCDAIRSGDGVLITDRFFMIRACRTCQQELGEEIPLVVLKEHRRTLTADEQQAFEEIVATCFPGRVPRGIGMRSIPDHWHEHMV